MPKVGITICTCTYVILSGSGMYVCMYLLYEAQHSKYIRYLSYEVVSIRNCVGSVRSGMQACGVKRK